MKIKAYPTVLFTSNYQGFDVIGKRREYKIRHEALCFYEGSVSQKRRGSLDGYTCFNGRINAAV
jgi:hypothetical protein